MTKRDGFSKEYRDRMFRTLSSEIAALEAYIGMIRTQLDREVKHLGELVAEREKFKE